MKFQRLKRVQEWYLGWEKVSCLERCPQYSGVSSQRERGSTVVIDVVFVTQEV